MKILTDFAVRGFSCPLASSANRFPTYFGLFKDYNMSLEQTACEDLKAFERRLTEVIACLQPATIRWRILLAVVSVCTAVGAWHWLADPQTSAVSFTQSLWNHPFFTLASIILVILFVMGIHKRVIAPSIITARTRLVLAEFNMSCDDTGKLLLKPRPTTNT